MKIKLNIQKMYNAETEFNLLMTQKGYRNF